MVQAVELTGMVGVLRRLARLRGPLGVLAFAVGFGVVTGLIATHVVLASWTYRDAARRDLQEPGRWGLAVLVGGLFVFGPYVLLQRLTDGSDESGVLGAARQVTRRGVEADETVGEAADRELEPATSEGDATTRGEGGSLTTTARYGVKAAGLGVRGARWAGRRALARMNNR